MGKRDSTKLLYTFNFLSTTFDGWIFLCAFGIDLYTKHTLTVPSNDRRIWVSVFLQQRIYLFSVFLPSLIRRFIYFSFVSERVTVTAHQSADEQYARRSITLNKSYTTQMWQKPMHPLHSKRNVKRIGKWKTTNKSINHHQRGKRKENSVSNSLMSLLIKLLVAYSIYTYKFWCINSTNPSCSNLRSIYINIYIDTRV